MDAIEPQATDERGGGAREYARDEAFLRRWTGKLPDRVRQVVDFAKFDLFPSQPVRALRRIEGESIDGNDFTVGVANASGPFQALQARVQELEGRNRELQGQLDESERGKRELRSMLDELRSKLDDQQQPNRQLTELVGITRASPAAASGQPPRVAAALPHTEVKADPSKKENDAATRVQANVRKHQAEADYQKQKLQAETEEKRLLQATANKEPAVVVQEEKTDAVVHLARYSIVDLSEAATQLGGAIDIVEDLEDAEKYYTDVTKGKQAPQKDRPRLIIMYGPPGCGKSYALKELYRLKRWSPEEFVHLDPDDCRMYCREYRLCISGAHAAKLKSVQEEYGDRLKPTKWISPDGQFQEDGFSVDGHYLALSSATMRSQFLVRKKMLWQPFKKKEMTDAFVDRAFVAGYHVVYDTMGKDPHKFLREVMRRARTSHNYQVFVCGCFAPWEMVYSRGRMRALETGRDVNAGFVRKEFDNMFPDAANGQVLPGQVDRSHHKEFEKELQEGDELFLFDHSVQDKTWVALHSVKGSDASSRDGEHQPPKVEEQQQEVEPDPLNADTLLKHFDPSNLSKSVAPVALCVEECSAMLNAQTRMRTTINELAHQLKEMKEMGTELMREQDRTHHNEDITELEKKISEKRKDLEKMEKSYPERRDNAISQYRPLLNQSVFRFNAAYAKLRKDEKQRIEEGAPAITEDALEYMKVRCKEVNKLKVDMVQPSGAGADDALNTLLALIHKAKKAVPVLEKVMDAVKTHVEKTCPKAKDKVTDEGGASIKGVPRCCAKVAEEYAGNYRKLCDLVRCTLVFPSLHAMAVALSFLTSGADGELQRSTDDDHDGYQGDSDQLSRAIVCRAKDRINPDYDAIKAGGNRDILLNLWLKLEDSDWIIAELQLHVKPLFDLKHDLHVLYKGARILGALEPETVEHQGKLTEQALRRAGEGVVLHLKCSNSTLADGLREKLQKMLQELLQKDECPLLELSLAGNSAAWQKTWKGEKGKHWPAIKDLTRQTKMNDFKDCSLHDLLIARRDQQLHCHRLRTLNLKGRGLHGTLPEKLATCIEMETLHLGYNSLKGPIPRAFKFMTKLKNLSLNYCELTGELPAELGELKNLERLCLDNNKLKGSIPSRFGGLSGGEKEEMKDLTKRKEEAKNSGSKMGKEDEARLDELKRLHKDAGLMKLKELFLNNNQLSGAIPDTLANCQALEKVDFTNNQLTGTVPPAWLVEKQCTKLEFFRLYNNEHMTQDSGRLEQLEQIARDGDAYWERVVDKSKWRFVRLEASRSPSVAAALPHTEVKADPSKKENDAATRVQANVRKHQAEADYQRQKLQAEKRLLQATADEEPAAVVQEEKTDAGVHPDHSKIENDAATRVQANVRKHQAEADYQRQKLQAEKRLLQATADEEPAIVEQQNMRMVDAQKQRKELTAERDADGISTT